MKGIEKGREWRGKGKDWGREGKGGGREVRGKGREGEGKGKGRERKGSGKGREREGKGGRRKGGGREGRGKVRGREGRGRGRGREGEGNKYFLTIWIQTLELLVIIFVTISNTITIHLDKYLCILIAGIKQTDIHITIYQTHLYNRKSDYYLS